MQHAQEGKGKRKVFVLYSFFKDKFLKSKKKRKIVEKDIKMGVIILWIHYFNYIISGTV